MHTTKSDLTSCLPMEKRNASNLLALLLQFASLKRCDSRRNPDYARPFEQLRRKCTRRLFGVFILVGLITSVQAELQTIAPNAPVWVDSGYPQRAPGEYPSAQAICDTTAVWFGMAAGLLYASYPTSIGNSIFFYDCRLAPPQQYDLYGQARLGWSCPTGYGMVNYYGLSASQLWNPIIYWYGPDTMYCGRTGSGPIVEKNGRQTCQNPDNSCGIVGKPINPAIGNELLTETDYSGSSASPLKFVRFYDSAYRVALIDPLVVTTTVSKVPLGSFWSHTYHKKIQTAVGNAIVTARVQREEGLAYYFNSTASGWVSDEDITDQLITLTDGSGNAIGWRYSVAMDGSSEIYDSSGKLLTIVSRDGLTQTLTYSDALTPTSIAPIPGLLIQVTDPKGRQLTFSYDARGRLSTMTDPAGGQYQYSYDGATAGCIGRTACNMLTQVTYPPVIGDSMSRTHTYAYGEAAYSTWTQEGALTGIVDENANRWATIRYDATGKATSSELSGGVNKYTLDYTARTVVDPLNTTRTYTYLAVQGVNKIAGIAQPCAPSGCTGTVSSSATYDVNGNASSRLDFNQNRTCYAYDLSRNLETKRVEGLASSSVCSTVLVTPLLPPPPIRCALSVLRGTPTGA